ncbi:MAG: hypothetical protein JO051_18265 [Acidobacteriaceae bacterium]|nr:hypothetical protein [Acidobacteriaceae bacterium]
MHGGRALFLALMSVSASGQFRVAPEQSARLDFALTESLGRQTLACNAESTRPFLDFAFRFEIGYQVHCPLKEFGGVESTIAAYTRVQPVDGGTASWFIESYRVPGIPDEVRSRINLLREHSDIQFGGVIASGEGEYAVDLVLVDRRHRLFHTNWRTKVAAHGAEMKAPLSMHANTVAALGPPDWPRTVSGRNLGRVTVMVDAAPIHAGSTRLRSWDGAFLVEALSSVLTLLPSNSVRVVAFNLDQQQEVFQADDFSVRETQRLTDALDQLELSKISYQALEQAQESCRLLMDLLEREIHREKPTDAIILLGPANRLSDRIPAEFVADRGAGAPPIFYLKYSPLVPPARFRMPLAALMSTRDDPTGDPTILEAGNHGEFPDVIQYAAAVHDGVTMNLHSPADLAEALRKIDRKLHPVVASAGNMGR